MKIPQILSALMLCSMAAHAEVKLPNTIASNMVIQQNTNARVWGTASKNARVEVRASWSDAAVSVSANSDGFFLAQLPTPAGSFQPQTITFKDMKDGKTTSISNVLIGEVWIASGQSNMQMPLKGFPGCCVEDGWEEITFSDREADHVRFITQYPKHSYEPLSDLDGTWTVPSAASATEYSATAWHFAKNLSHALNVPVGIVSIAYGGSKVESWMNADNLRKHGYSTDRADIDKVSEEYLKILLPYNAMFCPVRNVTARGIIWYQGESNVGAQNFEPLMKDMVAQWRQELGLGDIPFYMCEIAPYYYGPDNPAALLRESQYKLSKEIPNCGLVSTCDLALPQEKFNIHPRQKKQVGQRLAWMALHNTYGRDMYMSTGPTYKTFYVEGAEAFVEFSNLQMGICSNYMIEGFDIAGDDHVFHRADSVWLKWQTNHVVVSSKKVAKPVAVRFCFRDFSHANLFGGGFLPAYPFRTDNWTDARYAEE
ncbi:MAG: sialate O-acetylesterase [Bacteroidales bacterium]|nr:sialate O-acetylesterase [Bacteroidales bacterium]